LYRPFNCQPIGNIIEPWGCSKAHQDREAEILNFPPKWHDPSHDELSFANELLQFHFQSALEDLLTICQTKVHSETGRYASSGHGNDLASIFLLLTCNVICAKEKK